MEGDLDNYLGHLLFPFFTLKIDNNNLTTLFLIN